LIGLVFALVGTYFALAGFDQISHGLVMAVPGWVAGCVGLTFATVGLLFGGAAARSMVIRARGDARRKRFPAQPWMHDYPWCASGISDQPGRRLLAGLLNALFLPLFLVPFNWLAFSDGIGTHPIQWMVGLFNLVAILAIARFAYQALRALTFGRTQLAFFRFPFAPGDELDVALSPVRSTRMTLTLRFVMESMVKTGAAPEMHSWRWHNVGYQAIAIWQEVRQLSVSPEDSWVPIRWQLPDNPEYVNQLEADPAVRYWELLVEANEPGVNFRTTFPLPVYPDSQLDPSARISVPLAPLTHASRHGFAIGVFALVLAILVGAGSMLLPVNDFFSRTLPDLVTSAPKIWNYRQSIQILNLPVWKGSGIEASGDIVWAITDAGLRSFPTAMPSSGDLSPVPFPAISLHADSGQPWIGGKRGQIFDLGTRTTYVLDPPLKLVKNGRRASEPEDVVGIVSFRGDTFAQATALYRFSPTGRTFKEVSEPAARRFRVFSMVADGDEALYVATWKEIWRYDGKWRRWFAGDWTADAMAIGSDGRLYVGDNAHVLEIDKTGQAQRQWEVGSAVRALAIREDRLYVGTLRSGLWTRPLPNDEPWTRIGPLHGLPEGQITGMTFDAKGNLWLAIEIKREAGGIVFLPGTLFTD